MSNKEKSINGVPFLDLATQYRAIKKEIWERFDEVLELQNLILGPQVEELEKAVADYCGAKFSIGVGSGSDAILLSLMGFDIGNGDEVITTPFTFFSTASAISRVGARPVFVDIDIDTFNIDPNKIEEKITKRTKAIIPVHLFGQCADMEAIVAIAKRYNLKIIEDAAQAIGAEYQTKDSNRVKACSIGDTGCLSFYPSKNLGCFGEGGMITTNDEELSKKLKALRAHGSKERYYHYMIGVNSRLDTMQAVVLLVKIKYLDEWTKLRNKKAQVYNEGLKGIVKTPYCRNGNFHVYNQYVIMSSKIKLIEEVFREGRIGYGRYYPLPLHMQKCFEYLGYKKGDFPDSELASEKALALPIYPELGNDQQEIAIRAIKKAV